MPPSRAPRLVLAVLLGGFAGAAAVAADGPEDPLPDPADAPSAATDDGGLGARLAALEADVARLKARRDVDARRRYERERVVADALADAEARTARLDQAAIGALDRRRSTGQGVFEGRPILRSADGEFQLGLALHVQARFVAGRLGDAGPGEDSTVAGTELRRTRLKAIGHLLDERLGFQLGGGFSDDGDPFSITDAWVEWSEAGAAVRVGNFRPIFLREEQTSAKRLPGIERSLVSRLVRQLRRPGVLVSWRQGPVRLHGSVQDPDSQLGGDAWQAAARAEWKLTGAWRGLRQETGFLGSAPAAAIGAGVLHVGSSGQPDVTLATADILWTGDGWGLTLVATLDDPEEAERAWGATARAGWFVDDRLEVVGRVQVGDAEDELLTVGAGVNWYVAGHDLKVQADVLHALDGPGGRWRTAGTGWRAEAGHGQTVLRMQAQVAF